MTFKYFSNSSAAFMNDVFKRSGRNSTTTTAFLLKLNQPLQKTNHAQNNPSQIYSIKYLEQITRFPENNGVNLNMHKHRVKRRFSSNK